MTDINDILERIIESAGHFTQTAGLGRVLGQIFAYMYFSSEPQSLDSITEALGISKGSASTGVRQLEKWGGLKKIRVRGDRKDYYEANTELGPTIKGMLRDTIGGRMEHSMALFERAEHGLDQFEPSSNNENGFCDFTVEQIEKLRGFRERTLWMWDNVISGLLDPNSSVVEAADAVDEILFGKDEHKEEEKP